MSALYNISQSVYFCSKRIFSLCVKRFLFIHKVHVVFLPYVRMVLKKIFFAFHRPPQRLSVGRREYYFPILLVPFYSFFIVKD